VALDPQSVPLVPALPAGGYDDGLGVLREPERRNHSPHFAVTHENDPNEDDNRASPFGWFPVLVLVLLVGGGLFVMFALRNDSNLQDCVQSGRKNCAPIDTTNLK
jgi:hypothetical protein